jgi:hypothetical protein
LSSRGFANLPALWAAASSIDLAREDIQRLLLKGIVTPSFRDILIPKHPSILRQEHLNPQRSKTFEECLAEAQRVIGFKQDIFVQRLTFLTMKREEGEGQSAYIRRCEETARRADLPTMTVKDHAMHIYLSGCGQGTREFVILNSCNKQPTLERIKDTVRNKEYIATWIRWRG